MPPPVMPLADILICWFALSALAFNFLVGYLLGTFLRGRPDGGALFGLLGPVGWALVAAGPDYRAKCPECRGVIDPRARLCRHCRSPLGLPPPAHPAVG